MSTRPIHRLQAWGSALLLVGALWPATAGAELFDFDGAPIHSGLPIDQTVGGITAHFSATGQGFSIQPANTLGFTPAGFGGLCIYPSSVFAADLLVSFSVTITDFSIMYAPQELGCDDTATMRVTAYMDATSVGTATAKAPFPGTWPTGTLSYSNASGFNHVVVHYDLRPACGDWGPIFMADNMNVIGATTSVPPVGSPEPRPLVRPNPFRATTEVRFQLDRSGPLTVTVHDVSGRLVRTLVREVLLPAGPARLEWDGRDDAGAEARGGVYFCRVKTDGGETVTRVVMRR